jgi:transportin-3
LQSLGTRLRHECERVSALPSQHHLTHWHSIEASLFSLQSTARYTSVDEMTMLPFVFSIIPQLPVSVFYLRNTACLVVGKYAPWLGRNPDYLKPILPFLATGLSIPKSASASANAIKILCESCNSTLSLGDSVLALYDDIVTASNQSPNPILCLRDELQVLEGACKAITIQLSDATHGLASERITIYIQRLVEPIGTRLANTTFVGQGSTSPKLALNEIERLTVVARFLHLPRPQGSSPIHATNGQISSRSEFLLQLMTQCWPLLDSLSQKYPTDFSIAESICRLHKHVLRGCGSAGYRDMIQQLCSSIVRGYTLSHLSPYLYLASICVSEYGSDSRYVPLLFDMIRELSDKTFSVLQTPQDLVSHPDVVEELFFLAGRMMTHCPVPLLLSPLLEAMIKFSIICMNLDHKDANRGTLSFLESLVVFGMEMRHGQMTRFTNDPQQMKSCRESLEKSIQREGPSIVHNLIQSLMGNLPCYRIDVTHGSVGSILYKLNELCPALLYEWLTLSLQPAPEHARKTLLRSFTTHGTNMSMEDFMSSIRWFSNYCLRETKIRGGGS